MQDWELRVRKSHLKNCGKSLAFFERQIFQWSYEYDMQIRDGNGPIAKICKEQLDFVTKCREELIESAVNSEVCPLTREELQIEALRQNEERKELNDSFKEAK